MTLKGWIQTHMREAFDPLKPDPAKIHIEDIAHALSNVCRFTGHTDRFYSVAEHSVYVSQNCDPADAMAGLLHDASEAYMCDVAAPIKQAEIFEGYRWAERYLQITILNRFGLDGNLPESVKVADLRMLATEALQLLGPRDDWDLTVYGEPYPFRIAALDPTRARSLFMRRYFELGGK